MQTLHFTITRQQLRWVNPCRNPVEGTVGDVLAQFEVDSEWDGLAIMAVFANTSLMDMEQPQPVLWRGDPIPVPAVALAVEGRLTVGLVGYADDGSRRLTTEAMRQGIPVRPSAGTGGTVVDPDPSLWEQTLSAIGDMSNLDTEDKSSLVAAINEAAKTGTGGADIDRGEVVTVVDSLPDVSGDEQVVYLVDDPTDDDGVDAARLLIAILRAGTYDPDQTANIDALAVLLGVETGEDAGIIQVDDVLIITSGATVVQSGSTLRLT